jgi:integrase/recombinase XerD
MPDPLPLPSHDLIVDSIEDYLAECRARGLRSSTVTRSYGFPLRRVFLPWCRQHGVDRLPQIDQPLVNRFTAYLRDRGREGGQVLSPHSVRAYGVAITRWLAWAHAERAADGIPPRVPRGRLSRPVREVITDEEYRRMHEAVQNDRDRLILQLLWETGMRASELLGLRIGDLVKHDNRWFLRVLSPHLGGGAKDSRERLVPVPQARELRRYLDGPRRRQTAETDHILLARNRNYRGVHTALTISGLEQVVKGAARDAGIERRVFPHLFRHSAVTRWLRAGVDPLRIAAVVGHSSLAMIQMHYSQLDHRDAFDALAAVLAKER